MVKLQPLSKTFRVRSMGRCKQIAEGLINHRQWFTFRPLIHPAHFIDEYEFDLDRKHPKADTTLSRRVTSKHTIPVPVNTDWNRAQWAARIKYVAHTPRND